MIDSRFSAELRSSIANYLSQCGLIVKKDVIQRICQITYNLSQDMTYRSLSNLVELYESPKFLKIYPNRDKNDGVWDKDLFDNLLSFNDRLKRQNQSINGPEKYQLESVSQSWQASQSGIDSYMCQFTSILDYGDKSASNQQVNTNPLHHQSTEQKTQSRKLLQKQVLIMDAFIDFPKIQAINTASGICKLKYIDNQFNQFEPIAIKSNGSQESRLNYFSKRMAYIRNKVLALKNGKTRNYRYTELAYNSNINDDTDQANEKPEFLANTQQINTNLRKKINIIGILVSGGKGQIFLQDQYGKIRLNLNNAKFEENVIFNQGSIVIVRGISQEEGSHCILNVIQIQHPPRQSDQKAFEEFKEPFTKMQILNGAQKIGKNKSLNDDWFGAELLVAKKIQQLGTLALVNTTNTTPSASVHLDQNNVTDSIYVISQITRKSLKELSNIFQKMNREGVPAIIILIGEFNAHASCQVSQSMRITKQFFSKLAEILIDMKELRTYTQWVIIPGPDDFLPFSALPNVHLSKKLMPKLKKVVSKLKLASNPCRISYYGKEILICRADFAKLFLMNNVVLRQKDQPQRQASTGFKSKDMVETIIRQGNLLPFLKKSQLMLWNYSDSFHLDKLPDCMILADSFLHFQYEVSEGKYVVSPGIFSENRTFLGIFCQGDRLQAQLIDLNKIQDQEEYQEAEEQEEAQKNKKQIQEQDIKLQN